MQKISISLTSFMDETWNQLKYISVQVIGEVLIIGIGIVNSIACRTHLVYGIPKVMLGVVEIQLAETNPEFSKTG